MLTKDTGTRIRNEEIRWRTKMETVAVILMKVRLQWLDDRQIPRQALTWFPTDAKEDLEDLGSPGVTW